MSGVAWLRLAAVAIGAFAGLGLGSAILVLDAPRSLVAISGILLACGVACTVLLVGFLWYIIIEHVRPRAVLRKPILPLTLNTELGAMIGTRRFTVHPVKMWGGLISADRLFIGFLWFHKANELTFADPSTLPNTQEGRG